MSSVAELESALRDVACPSGRVLRVRKVRATAKNRASIVRPPTEAVGYMGFHGFDSGYGNFAKRLGLAMGKRSARIGLLVEFTRPGELKNK